MIIGSGLLAQAFAPEFSDRSNICIYAAGVSNSSCSDVHEFERERQRLSEAISQIAPGATLVYFSTCSVVDPEACQTPYVRHKLAMEQLVASRKPYLILRLPQVAGRTPNPHTLLNYLYARISRSESFTLWRNARRNIIDVEDVVAVAHELLADTSMRNTILNIASPINYAMPDIVHALERAIGKAAIYEVAERGSGYMIDINTILPFLDKAEVRFDDGYLERVIRKYYGKVTGYD